jgi:ADP-heptose:LPS heptosyltransferase
MLSYIFSKSLWFSHFKLQLRDRFEFLARPEMLVTCAEPIMKYIRASFVDEQISLQQVRRIIVVQPDLIGDVLLTTPFLRELRLNAPKAQITLLVDKGAANLVELCPYVNRIVSVDSKNWRLYWRWKFAQNAFFLGLSNLLWRRFDLAIFPHWGTDHYYASAMCYFSGAKMRVAYSEDVCEEKRVANRNYDQLFTHVFLGSLEASVTHESENLLALLSLIGGNVRNSALELWIDEKDRTVARRLLGERPANCVRIAICLGASHERKRWLVENFDQVIEQIRRSHTVQFVVVGSKSETHLVEQLRSSVISSVGATTLRECAAIMEQCDLYVGNDTGPMHIAAAMGLPIVAVSCHPQDASLDSSYAPNRFGPKSNNSLVLQPSNLKDECVIEKEGLRYCRATVAHCILGVPVEAVLSAVETLLAAHSVNAKQELY